MQIIKYHTEQFNGKTTKDAYLKACKWVAKFIVSKEKLENSFIQYRKSKEANEVFVDLYAGLSEEEINESFCKKCKEFHTAFFVKNSLDCSQCKNTAYRNQVEDKLKIKKTYRKEQLRKLIYD